MSLIGIMEEARRRGDPAMLVDAVPYARYLGMSAKLQEGRLITRLPFRESNLGNPMRRAIHGGVVGAFLDLSGTFQLWWDLEGLSGPRCVSCTVDYLRSAGPRDVLAASLVTRLGRRVASVRVEAWQERRDRPIAHGHAHFLITEPNETRNSARD